MHRTHSARRLVCFRAGGLVSLAIILCSSTWSGADDTTKWCFPPVGELQDKQLQREPEQVGLQRSVIAKLKTKTLGGRWALWRRGFLVHVEGDFNKTTEVKSLRKTWHALMVGAAIKQKKIKSVDERISDYSPELKGKDATATWRHVMTQTSGFDYPDGDYAAAGMKCPVG